MACDERRSLASRWAAMILVAVAAAACGAAEQEEAEVEAMDEVSGTTSDSVPTMEMSGGQRMQMSQQMQAHMQQMSGVSGDSLMAAMPMHRQMVGQMLQGMDPATMRMSGPSDSTWSATLDSVRNDLTRMEGMSAEELQGFMPDHRARVQRLMSMHDSVMGMP